jgi:hypothetical protein
VERENVFFKSFPVDEYYLPQMNCEKVFLVAVNLNLQLTAESFHVKQVKIKQNYHHGSGISKLIFFMVSKYVARAPSRRTIRTERQGAISRGKQ